MEEEVKLFEIVLLEDEKRISIVIQNYVKKIERDLRDVIKKIDKFISSLQRGYKGEGANKIVDNTNTQKEIIKAQITALQEIYDSEETKIIAINRELDILDPSGLLRAKMKYLPGSKKSGLG